MNRHLQYNRLANLRMIEWMMDRDFLDEKIHLWMSHIIDAQELWNSRIEGREARLGVWELILPNSLLQWNEKVHKDSEQIDSLTPRNNTVAYTNTKGQKFESSVGEIFDHLFTHGSYHRGQIASRIRVLGGNPPYTDYIEFCRSGI